MAKRATFILLCVISIIPGIEATTQDLKCNHQQRMCEKLPMAPDGIIRLSKIEVDPEYLDEYIGYANEVGETSLRTEPGVLTMYAMQDKENPCHITILETYASADAYRSHIASAHFQKYKQGTLHMVRNLILSDQTVMNPANRLADFIDNSQYEK